MELRQIHYFVAVAEELHFARAAARLHVSQQALSFQIKQLEDELGTGLFDRTTRRVELTEAGRAFLSEARVALDHLREGVEAAQRAGRGEVGQLMVGYTTTMLYNIMPTIVRVFRERYPDVEVILQETVQDAIAEAIRSRKIDIGLTGGLSRMHFPDLNYEILYRDTLAVAIPKDHALADCKGIPLSALSNEPFVMYSRFHNEPAFDQIIALCQQAGFSPHIVQEASSGEAVLSLVAAGAGIAFAVSSMHTLRSDEVVYQCLIDPVHEGYFGTVWRRDDQSPLVKAFVQMAHEIALGKAIG